MLWLSIETDSYPLASQSLAWSINLKQSFWPRSPGQSSILTHPSSGFRLIFAGIRSLHEYRVLVKPRTSPDGLKASAWISGARSNTAALSGNHPACGLLHWLVAQPDLSGMRGHIPALILRKPSQRARMIMSSKGTGDGLKLASCDSWLVNVVHSPWKVEIAPHYIHGVLEDDIP